MPTLTMLARWGGQGDWAGGPWWLVIALLIVVAVMVGLVVRGRRARVVDGSDAVAILAARFARGEIESDEYRQRLDELKGL